MSDTLDDLTVRNLKATGKEYTKREKGGFGVRVHPSGRKVFFYLYRVGSVRRFLNLGDYKDKQHPNGITLEAARKAFTIESAKVTALKDGRSDGIDPLRARQSAAEQRAIEEAELRKQLTFNELAKDYIEENVKDQVVDKSLYDIQRVLLSTGKAGCVDDFKEIRNLKACSITLEDVSKLLKRVTIRSASAARNIIKTARPMYAFAVARGIVNSNPFEMHKVNTFLPKAVRSNLKPTIKERTLDDSEIKALWQALSNCTGGDIGRDALRLLLLTGQRPTEVLGMHSEEVSGSWWTLQKERTKARLDKQRRDHIVYLVPEAISIISGKQGLLFKYSSSDNHMPVNALGKMIRKNNFFGLAPWGSHDLRRTVRTYMSDIDGISTKAAEAVLNHAHEGTMKNYDQHKYHRQIENALTLWRDRLEEIIGEPLLKPLPDNVISIKQGRKKAA